MNTINFNLLNGLPMNQDVLDRLQTAYSIFNLLGNIVGEKTIIAGCELTGSTVSDGGVYVNGEVFKFVGGLQQTKVIIKEDSTNLTFKNNNSYPVIKTRYVTFGSGVGEMLWSDFKKGFPTKDIVAGLLGKADQTSFDALADAFSLVYTKMLTIETGAQKNLQEFYDYGTVTTQNRQTGINEFDYTKNYAEIFPPSGYTMAHLKAFMPSIAKIAFAGNVNVDDTMWCNYQVGATKITVTCNNSESRETSKINYIAIWKK